MTIQQHACCWQFAAGLTLCLSVLPLVAQQDSQTFRAGVELFLMRVQVRADRGRPLPELTASDFTARIGSRTPPVLHVEHLRPSDEELRTWPYNRLRWPKGEQLAVYLVGVDADQADCRNVPKVSLTAKGVKVRAVAWQPKIGCAPPNASQGRAN